MRAHLEVCPACRAEADQLRPVVAVLPLADVDRVAERPSPPPDLEERVVSRVIDERSRRPLGRRRVARVAVGVAAALAILVGTWALIGPDGAGVSVTFREPPPGVRAAAVVEPRAWGTLVELDVSGLPGGELYRVWLKANDGERVPAGTFIAVPGGEMHLVLAAGLELPAVHGLGISTADDDTIMYAAL